jgi:hypothetical protein
MAVMCFLLAFERYSNLVLELARCLFAFVPNFIFEVIYSDCNHFVYNHFLLEVEKCFLSAVLGFNVLRFDLLVLSHFVFVRFSSLFLLE